jgi:hypothetical protein
MSIIKKIFGKVHVRNTIKELIADWNQNGCNGVKVEAELEGSDEPEPGEQTLEDKAKWDRDYAIFIVAPIYIVPDDEFWTQLRKTIHAAVGKKMQINVWPQCREVEVMRPGAIPFAGYKPSS